MKTKSFHGLSRPLTKPGKRATPTYQLSARQRRKLQKQRRRDEKDQPRIIIDDPLHSLHPNSPAKRIRDFEQGIW